MNLISNRKLNLDNQVEYRYEAMIRNQS